MAVSSYVLIEANVGMAKQVAIELRRLSRTDGNVRSVDLVTGPFDVICVVEAVDLQDLGNCLTEAIQTVEGVKRTTTCLTIQVSGDQG